MNQRILELADEIKELDASEKNAVRKQKWIAHQNSKSSGEILLNVHFWKNVINPMWKELVPDSEVMNKSGDEYYVERMLLQRIKKFTLIDDDDVLLPTIWIDPVLSEKSRMFGIEEKAACDGVSVKFETVINDINDLKLFEQPVFDIDIKKTDEIIERITELVYAKVPVKVKAPILQANPFEYAAKFRSMEDLFVDFIDNPGLVHAMMEMFTDFIVHRFKELDSIGFDPEQTWDFRVHYDRIEDAENKDTLKNCWVYISDQSAGVISPNMFSEFIYPYHERIAELFGKVYFHGCEDLTYKAKYIKNLPNLKRFHISPWSNPDSITKELGSRFVYEAHVHPANHLFVYDNKEKAADIKRLCSILRDNGAVFDLNLSDLETINNDTSRLTDWAKIARDAVGGL